MSPLMNHLLLLLEAELGDNCIQNFYLGRYIVRYMVGNLEPLKALTTSIEIFRLSTV